MNDASDASPGEQATHAQILKSTLLVGASSVVGVVFSIDLSRAAENGNFLEFIKNAIILPCSHEKCKSIERSKSNAFVNPLSIRSCLLAIGIATIRIGATNKFLTSQNI